MSTPLTRWALAPSGSPVAWSIAQWQGGRTTQEDRAAGGTFPGGAWGVVADGMGGHPHGALAAALAVDTIAQACRTSLPDRLEDDPLLSWMQTVIDAAHVAVQVLSAPDTRRPGTTVLWAIATHRHLCLCHVGDSRGILVTDSTATTLTIDHTPAGDRVRAGTAAPASQNTAPDAHILTQAVGLDRPTPEWLSGDWGPGDWIFLATDGCNACTPDHWVTASRLAQPGPAILTRADGQDNATVVVLHNRGQ